MSYNRLSRHLSSISLESVAKSKSDNRIQINPNMTSVAIPESLSAKFKDSFAYKTISNRLPVILTKAIDTTSRQLKHLVDLGMVDKDHRAEAEQEMKDAIGRLAKLRNEMETNKPFVKIVSDAPDVKIYNQSLEDYKKKFGSDAKWFECEWLFAECYMYRRVREAFEVTKHVKNYDPFNESKEHALKSSIKACEVLAKFLLTIGDKDKLDMETQFIRFIEVSLWGNKCDLSLSGGADANNFTNPTDDLVKLRDFIVANQVKDLWNYVKTTSAKKPFQLSIVLDNSGFELFTDLILVEFLTISGILKDKSVVRWFVKSMPWYVSDVMNKDFHWLVNYLADDSKSHSKEIKQLGQKWKNNLKAGKWLIVEDNYWTLPYDYSHMSVRAPKLYQSLSESDLILFKGDLNYRKLVGDLNWDFSVPFKTALRGFLPTAVCTLRTVKADVVVGIEDKKMLEKVKTFKKDWRETGEYAVIEWARK